MDDEEEEAPPLCLDLDDDADGGEPTRLAQS